MMFYMKSIFYLIVFALTIAFGQINFYLTDEFNNNENDIVFQHHCLYIPAVSQSTFDPYEIMSFCLTEFPSKWNIKENDIDKKLTFFDLYKQNITSEQLYQWSASIDLIERYEFYLISNQTLTSISNEIFYNCTSPRFGPQCQYSFIHFSIEEVGLTKIFADFYNHEYDPTSLTCYIHLECNRGSKSLCLDWTEICDGYIDCLNDQIDEKYCWQLEINQCKEDEYRCLNGQCISKKFNLDNVYISECLDRSDLPRSGNYIYDLELRPPTIIKEDIICSKRYNEMETKLTSSCIRKRDTILKTFMLNDTPNSLSDECWFTMKCVFYFETISYEICREKCIDTDLCIQIIKKTCPELIIVSNAPIAFGHIYVGYLKEIDDYTHMRRAEYICYDDKLCGGFKSNAKLISFNNKTCRRVEDFPLTYQQFSYGPISRYLQSIYTGLYQCNTIIYDDSTVCNSSLMYRCINSSKCISKSRLCDGKIDCDFKDDEACLLNNGSCFENESNRFFKCLLNNKCISRSRLADYQCDCPYMDEHHHLCEDENIDQCDPNNLDLCNVYATGDFVRRYISFPTICDGFTELIPVLIDGQNHTDETECHYWKCNNTYTRCNNFWNCFDGADEVNCKNLPSLIECPLHHHICVSPVTFQLLCLPIEKANDGYIDCLGAFDEPKICRSNYHLPTRNNFVCDKNDKNDKRNCININSVCQSECIAQNEPLFCNLTKIHPVFSICERTFDRDIPSISKSLCTRLDDTRKTGIINFSIDKKRENEDKTLIQEKSVIKQTFEYNQVCHRGFPLKIYFDLNNNSESNNNIVCLCPSSYYGNYCQYQNQRVSLTLQFQTYSDSRRILFSLIIFLIDNNNQKIIHSYKQLTFIYIKYCNVKLNFYLTYSQRPKDLTKNYSIHIDIYEKKTFAYRGSLFLPLNYLFLPVHRIGLILNIPRNNKTINNCFLNQCINGRCTNYSENSDYRTFCKCNQGWTGRFCTIPIKCNCSSDSLCIDIGVNNRSICICPPNKWGPRCLLRNNICQLNSNLTCLNNGQCIPVDEYMVSDKKFLCICPKGFSGEKCEIEDVKIIISFDKNIILPEVMLIHFIEVRKDKPILNGSTFQSIPLYQKKHIVYWAYPFHIVFVELSDRNYYLIHVENNYNSSAIIEKLINSSDRCGNLKEYLNETIINYHPLRRIKYYHLPCQNTLISCFYDKNHMCLCNQFGSERIANCFEFNSSLSHNCFGQSNCENDGRCIQDSINCPQTTECLCPECYYGTLCQFSLSLFDLSLDGILGYHIQSNTTISNQPSIIKTSLALIILMCIISFINGILSIFAFQNKQTRQVGCGYYLLGSTITTLLTAIMLIIKFSILIVSQMLLITNQSFLNISCHSLDFLLQVCLNMDRWLNGCIAIERAFNIIKGASFNKKKSQKVAKYTICLLVFLTTSTTIYDPIYPTLSRRY